MVEKETAGMLSAKQILERLRDLRDEIKTLSMLDSAARLSRDSQVSWNNQGQHEARLARIEAIRQEIADLMGKDKL
jgi:hypothetical protein